MALSHNNEVVPAAPMGRKELSSALGNSGSLAKGIALLQLGPAIPLLRHAALHAFWDIPQTDLTRLATELEVVVPAPTTRVQTVSALLSKICPDLKPDQVLQVLESKPPPLGLEETMDLPCPGHGGYP